MLKGFAKASTSVGKIVEKIPVISKGQADEALITAGDKLDELNAGKLRKQMSSLIERQSNSIRPFIENIDTVWFKSGVKYYRNYNGGAIWHLKIN
ncbi:MAG: hypothetical protein Q4C80_07360 [Bacillota bacterium]|nr:hypothetical protein [Bacillota bacterium]